MKARCASEYIGRGEDYIDKADGQRKFVIPNTEARLSTGFTMGQLNPPEGGHKDVSLPALLHHPELYRNYPELAEMRVRLYWNKAKARVRMYNHRLQLPLATIQTAGSGRKV